MPSVSSTPTQHVIPATSHSSSPFRWHYFIVLCVAVALRLALSLVNLEANDDHQAVIGLLMVQVRSLGMQDCHECFHPKLFYLICVCVFKLLGVTTVHGQIVGAQLLNMLAGLAMLWIVGKSLHSQSYHHSTIWLATSLVALNPKFIAINSQCSNDTFAMLFSTAAVHWAARFLRTQKLRDLAFTQAALGAAVLTKGTTWVVAIAIILFFTGRALSSLRRYGNFYVYALLTATIWYGATQFGDYDFDHFDVYARFGKGQPLHFFKPNIVGRPGIISVADSYLTFNFLDLLMHPTITNETALIPLHRASLWTQLYGHAHFAHFDYYPPSWQTRDPLVLNVGRIIFVLALLPTCVLIWGGIKVCRELARSLPQHFRLGQFESVQYLYLLVAFGYLAFSIKFTFDYRDFAAMKAIYLFPGIIAYAQLFSQGMDDVLRRFSHHRTFMLMIWSVFVALLIAYSIDILLLVVMLYPKIVA